MIIGWGAEFIPRFSRYYIFLKGFVIYLNKLNAYFLRHYSIVYIVPRFPSITFELRYLRMLSSLFFTFDFEIKKWVFEFNSPPPNQVPLEASKGVVAGP